MFRRVCVLATLLGLVLAGTPAHSGIRVERTAEGFFLLPERNGRTPAIYIHATEIDAVAAFFIIYRASCADRTDYETCVVSSDNVISRYVRDGEVFEVEPRLGSAHFKITHKGVTHEVRWSATSDPRPWDSGYDCRDAPVPSYAGIERDASARGKLFGHKVEASADSPADVSLTAAAYRC